METVASSFVPRAEGIAILLQNGDSAQLVTAIWEHGLQVLDKLSFLTPRKDRKGIEALCERVEAVVQDTSDAMAKQISAHNKSAQLAALAQCLSTVEALNVDEIGTDCIATVTRALDAWDRCACAHSRRGSPHEMPRARLGERPAVTSERSLARPHGALYGSMRPQKAP